MKTLLIKYGTPSWLTLEKIATQKIAGTYYDIISFYIGAPAILEYRTAR